MPVDQWIKISAFDRWFFTFSSTNLKRWIRSWIGMTLVVFALCPWIGKGYWDAYVGYSGIVVAKGNYLWVPFRGVDRYIVIQDSQGNRTKRYVSAWGYVYSDIGSYVEKKRGFGEYPRNPGDLRPRDVEQLVKQRQAQR